MAETVGRGGSRHRLGGPVADLTFVVVAAPALAGFGWLAANDGLPWVRFRGAAVTEALPGWGDALLGGWMVSVAVVSLALPAVALVGWGRHRSVRRALAPYALVLVGQILLEISYAAVLFPSVVVFIGLTFTFHRLVQLRSARRVFARSDVPGGRGRRAVGGILSLGVIFWATNAVFLIFFALPRVVQLT